MIAPTNEPAPAPPDPAAPDTPEAARVRLSLSEINALCVRAARGAGLAWGEAEEAGWAASWLSQAGLAGPAITLAWLGDVAGLSRPVPAPGLWPAGPGAQCPLRCGIAFADFAGLPEGPGERALVVERVAHPLMAIPFLASAARRTGLTLRVHWPEGDVALAPGGTPRADALTEATGGAIADLHITPCEPSAHPQTAHDAAPPIRTIAIPDKRALDALALKIAVPATAQSRAGAGAATSDND